MKASSVPLAPLLSTTASSPAVAGSPSASAFSFHSSASSSPSLPTSMSSEVGWYLQQHARDEAEKAELRQQVRQLLATAPPAAQLPPLSSLLSSSFASVGSLLALSQLLHMSAALMAWGARRAYEQLSREVKKRDGLEGVARTAVSGVFSLYQQMLDLLARWL